MEGGMNAELWLSHADDVRPQVELQQAVWDELRWEEVGTQDVDVEVEDFVATLRGSVSSYRARVSLQRAAERVPGVRAVVNDIAVRLPPGDTRADRVLAAAVANALLWDIRVPHVKVTARVADGRVTLEGTVDRHSERLAAEHAIENLTGVGDVINRITIQPVQPPPDLRRAEAAVEHAALRGTRISVETQDRTVALRGRVHSLAERAAAERAVLDVPGVAAVDDQLTVRG